MLLKEISPYLDQASPWGNTGEALTFSVGQWNDFFCWSQMCTVGSLSPETAFLWRENIAKIAKLPYPNYFLGGSTLQLDLSFDQMFQRNSEIL